MPSKRTTGMVELECSHCGAAFYRYPSMAGAYCSNQCKYAAQTDHITPETFWARVDKNGPVPEHRPELGPCWIWTGPLNDRGYALARDGRTYYRASRVAYEMVVGPMGDLLACHHCDNPACVRPDHLFPGTIQDNHADMVAKGRIAQGDRHGTHRAARPALRGRRTRLNADLVKALRIRYAAGGVTFRGLAQELGIHYSTITQAVNGETWKHLT